MKKLILILSICTFAWLGVGGCGDEDCPTCPDPPVDGHYSGLAYLSMQFGFDGFYVFDTDSEKIVDSLMWPQTGIMVRDVSPDGKFMAVVLSRFAGFETRILAANTLENLAVFPSVGGADFSPNNDFLFAIGMEGFYKIELPGFTVVFYNGLFEGPAVYTVNSETRSIFAVVDNYTFYQVSYDSMKIIREWAPLDESGIPIFIVHFDVHPNGSLLYAVGSSGTTRFFVYDLESEELVSSYPMHDYFGGLRVTPDGSEVWVTDPGRIDIPFDPPDVGTVFIFDAYSGAYTGGISMYGFIADDPREPLDAKRVDFSPDGREAYITTGALGPRENPGTILRFDAHSRKLISNIFPNIDRFPNAVVVGPRP